MNKTIKSKQQIIVTSALPYVNNVPHLGNIIGCVLSADVYVRFLKSNLNNLLQTFKRDDEYDEKHDDEKYDDEKNNENDVDVIFVGGVDEYGTATEMKARELGITCKELCDQNYEIHKSVYDWFNINFDCYGRTSQPNGAPNIIDHEWSQTKITHEIFKSLCDKDLIIEKEENIMYCPQTNTYVADRFVIGECINCGSDKADGDQCDKCGKLLSFNDILNPRYKPNPNFKLEVRKTKNLYIDSMRIWEDNNMLEWFENINCDWTKTAIAITHNWIKMGLRPISITRDLRWGTMIPDTKRFGSQYNNKVFYVWFDAPIGYISITENCIGKEKSEKYWKNPETKLIQFMAKDNVQFHSIIFPITLRGSEYSKISNIDIVSTEYLMCEGQKFSKSKNTGLFCDDVIKLSTKYKLISDYWRAYLIFIRPENADSNFIMNDDGGMVDFINNILIKNIGNLLHRTSSIAYQVHKKRNIILIMHNYNSEMNSVMLAQNIKSIINDYITNMNKYKLADGLKTVLKFGTRLNMYINETEPWNLIKDNNKIDKLYTVMSELFVNVIKLSYLIDPFMPIIGQQIRNNFKFKFYFDHTVNKIKIEIELPLEKPKILINPVEVIEYLKK